MRPLSASVDSIPAMPADEEYPSLEEVARQLQLDNVRLATELVGADIASSTDLPAPSWEYRIEDDGAVRVGCFNHFAPMTLLAIELAEVIAEVADFIQDEIIEDLHSPWPVCPDHETGTYAQVVENEAVWHCRFGGHAVATIGQLTS